MLSLKIFAGKAGKRTAESAKNDRETASKPKKTGRPSKETLLERKLTELKAARTDLLLLEIEAKRKRLERELSGNDQLTSGDIERVVSYLGTLGFEIRPRESLAGDDLRSILKAAASAWGPALMSIIVGAAQQPATQQTAPVQVVVPSLQQPQQQPQQQPPQPQLVLEAPTSPLPPDVQPLAAALIGKTPEQGARLILELIPPHLRPYIEQFASADAAQIDKGLGALSSANPAFDVVVAWLRGQREWLQECSRCLGELACRQK